MKNILDYSKWMVNEGLSSVLYHFTKLSSVYSILKNDEIACSSALTGYEKTLSAGKPFYLSTQRSKNGTLGYAGNSTKLNVCIVLYGDKIRSKYTGKAVDYWKMSKDRSDYNSLPQYIDAIKSNELEDRIVSNEASIKGISKYIKEIHLFVPQYSLGGDKILLQDISAKAKELQLPLYVYDELKYFQHQQVSKAINVSDIEAYAVTADMEPEDNSLHNDENVLDVLTHTFSTLLYNNHLAYAKIEHYYKGNIPESVQEEINNFTLNAKRIYTSSYSVNSLGSIMSTEIANSKIYHSPLKSLILSLVTKEMKLLKATSIDEYVLIKFGYDSRIDRSRSTKKEYTLTIDGEKKSAYHWDKAIWHWISVDDFWNALPQDFAYSIDTIKKGDKNLERSYVQEVMDNENATYRQVYNMLVKNIGRKKAHEVFAKLNIEVQIEKDPTNY